MFWIINLGGNWKIEILRKRNVNFETVKRRIKKNIIAWIASRKFLERLLNSISEEKWSYKRDCRSLKFIR